MSEKKRKAEPLSKSVAVKRQRSALVGLNIKDKNGIAQCFHKVAALLYVSLAPVYVQEPEEGVKSQHLDPLIMTYFAPAGGVVLAHTNLELIGQDPERTGAKVAKVMYDSPFAYMWVSVEFLVWKPVPGDVVEGWINLQSPSHIGLLIHDTFNATIKRDSIPSDWTFVPNEQPQDDEFEYEEDGSSIGRMFNDPKSMGYWKDGNDNRMDGEIKFTVKSFNVSGRTVSVQGTLLRPGEVKDLTQFNSKEEYNASDNTPNKANKKKHVKFSPEPSEDQQQSQGSAGNAAGGGSGGSGRAGGGAADDTVVNYEDNSDSDSDSD